MDGGRENEARHAVATCRFVRGTKSMLRVEFVRILVASSTADGPGLKTALRKARAEGKPAERSLGFAPFAAQGKRDDSEKATATAKDEGNYAGRSDFEAPVESIGLQKPEMPALRKATATAKASPLPAHSCGTQTARKR